MTSSGHDLSDDSDANEQEKNSGPQIQLLSTYTPDASSPNDQFAAIPQMSTADAMAPATYAYPDPFYRSIFAPYDGNLYPPQPYVGPPMVHCQLMGIQQAGIPLPSDAVEGPVFVNAKQYHGILRRRQSRAKAESDKKAMKSSKPYVYESRHLHALKRARGCGGRFVHSKKNENEEENEIASQSNINLNSDKSDTASSEGKS